MFIILQYEILLIVECVPVFRDGFLTLGAA